MLNFAHWILQTTQDLMQNNALAGLGFGLLMLLLCVGVPLLFLIILVKGLKSRLRVIFGQDREAVYEEMQRENRSGLSSGTGRLLSFALALCFFAAAWVVQGEKEQASASITLGLYLLGGAAVFAGICPDKMASFLKFLDTVLPLRRHW